MVTVRLTYKQDFIWWHCMVLNYHQVFRTSKCMVSLHAILFNTCFGPSVDRCKKVLRVLHLMILLSLYIKSQLDQQWEIAAQGHSNFFNSSKWFGFHEAFLTPDRFIRKFHRRRRCQLTWLLASLQAQARSQLAPQQAQALQWQRRRHHIHRGTSWMFDSNLEPGSRKGSAFWGGIKLSNQRDSVKV